LAEIIHEVTEFRYHSDDPMVTRAAIAKVRYSQGLALGLEPWL